jgi:hypothetical protein
MPQQYVGMLAFPGDSYPPVGIVLIVDWDKPIVTIKSAMPLGRGEIHWASEGAHIVGPSVAFDTVGLPAGDERLNWYLHRAGESGVMRATVTEPGAIYPCS